MTTPSTGWKVPAMAWVPISAAIAAETVSNALRAYGLGTHLEKFTVSVMGSSVSLAGSVLVLAAVAVSLSQARAAWLALMPGPWRQRVVAGLAGLLLLAVSITAMASHILEAERAKTATEGGQSSTYDRTVAEYTTKKAELDKLANVRPIDAVRAEMNAAPVPRNVFRRTAECTDVTRDDSFTACKPILDLRQEMGLAIRKRELEPEVSSLKLSLDNQVKPEVASASEEFVAWWWAWLMGVAVVFVATFGTVIWAKPMHGTGIGSFEKGRALQGDGSAITVGTETVTGNGTIGTAIVGDPALALTSDTELQRLRRYFAEKEAAEDDPEPAPTRPRRKKSKRAQKKETGLMKLRARTLNGERPPLRVIMGRHRVSKATASRWRQEAMKAALN